MAFVQADAALAGASMGALSVHRSAPRRGVKPLIAAIFASVAATAFIADELALSRPIFAADAAVEPASPKSQSKPSVEQEWPLTDTRAQMVSRPGEGLQTKFSAAPALPFHFQGSDLERSRAVDCLAAAAWYEAGNDPVGQRSVMQVVLNRLKHPSFPKSVCGVVFQGSERRTGCQFTFTCDGSMRRRTPPAAAWTRAQALARKALEGEIDRTVFQATHYHADYVVPWWSAKLNKLTQIGAHIFYSWPGRRGALERSAVFAHEADIAALHGLMGRAGIPPLERVPHQADTVSPGAGSPALVQSGPLAKPPAMIAPPITDQSVLLQVAGPSQSGRWAVQALKTCTGRASCQVIGYDSAIALDENRSRSPESRDRPLFLFIRDAASGMDLTLWDCDRVARPSARQCLPADGPALRNLLRGR